MFAQNIDCGYTLKPPRKCYPDVYHNISADEQLNAHLISTFALLRGMAGKFVDTISIFNRKRNSVKMNTSGFAKIFHEQIDEIL